MNESKTKSNLAKRENNGNFDISVQQLQVENLKWGNAEEIQSSIVKLYQYAEKKAYDSISWYRVRKGRMAWNSRLLRFLAIILTSLGGLAPLISSIGLANEFVVNELPLNIMIGQFGYLFLGLAAACIGLDRFFGFSSGWMRYITTMMTIERALSDFRLDWAMMLAKTGENQITPDQVQLMLQRLKEFVAAIDGHVEQETQIWVSEFRTNLVEIEKTAKTQVEATRPGAIDITVTNGMDTDAGFAVALDGLIVMNGIKGTRHQIGYVPPGTHKVVIHGAIKGESLDASELVNVSPGTVANVTLALPVKEAQP